MSFEFRGPFCVTECWDITVDSELTKYLSFC